MPPSNRLSPRLQAVVEALPLRADSRVLEIGCGPRAAARAVAARLTSGRVAAATSGDGRLFVDGGSPLLELPIPRG